MPAKERCWRPTAEIKILRNQVHTLRDESTPFFLLQVTSPWSRLIRWCGRRPQSERFREVNWLWQRIKFSLRLSIIFYLRSPHSSCQCRLPPHLNDWNLERLTLSSVRQVKEELELVCSWQGETSSTSWWELSFALDKSSRSSLAAALSTCIYRRFCESHLRGLKGCNLPPKVKTWKAE